MLTDCWVLSLDDPPTNTSHSYNDTITTLDLSSGKGAKCLNIRLFRPGRAQNENGRLSTAVLAKTRQASLERDSMVVCREYSGVMTFYFNTGRSSANLSRERTSVSNSRARPERAAWVGANLPLIIFSNSVGSIVRRSANR
jgi:hypothetical protein